MYHYGPLPGPPGGGALRGGGSFIVMECLNMQGRCDQGDAHCRAVGAGGQVREKCCCICTQSAGCGHVSSELDLRMLATCAHTCPPE